MATRLWITGGVWLAGCIALAAGEPGDTGTPSASGVGLGRPVSARLAASGAGLGRPEAHRAAAPAGEAVPGPVRLTSFDRPALEPAAARQEQRLHMPRTAGEEAPRPAGTPTIVARPGDDGTIHLLPADGPMRPPEGSVVMPGPVVAGPHGGLTEWPTWTPVAGDPVAIDAMNGGEAAHGTAHSFWIRGEYLYWMVRDQRVPALVTSSPSTSAPKLGNPDTAVLVGGNIPNSPQAGVRISAGYWFDPCQHCGIDGSVYFLIPRNYQAVNGCQDGFNLGRPFFEVAPVDQNGNPLLPGEAAEVVCGTVLDRFNNPFTLHGSVAVKLSSKLFGGDLNYRENLLANTLGGGWSYHVDALLGVRFNGLTDRLAITEDLIVAQVTSPPNLLMVGDGIIVQDRFTTRNLFAGGQIGVDAELRWGRWFLDTRAKVAIGVNHQEVEIFGQTSFSRPGFGFVSAFPGGLLALPTNIGLYKRNVFSVLPEITLSLGYNLTDNLRLFAGYNAMYWTRVVRPGDQIDRVVNSTQLPQINQPGVLNGPARPAFSFRDTNFWAQGLNVGMEYRY